jgi:hypothetical protein
VANVWLWWPSFAGFFRGGKVLPRTTYLSGVFGKALGRNRQKPAFFGRFWQKFTA